MASSGEAYIYTGPWINWSHGLVRGATLTLPRNSGGLLIAFLAVFVGLSGSCFWGILCYFLHQSRASREKKDAMHHQQQAIIRNNAGPGATAWEFLRLGWCWRRAARSPFWRSLPLVLLASLNLAVFGVASIYSSEITKAAGNESLIRGSTCGDWVPRPVDSIEAQFGSQSKSHSDTTFADSYARACYNNTRNILECNQYIAQQLKWTVNANASCPFQPGRCMTGDNAAYEMDTGPIDSHFALGINAREKDRITYRRRVTCAPIFDQDVRDVEILTDQGNSFPGYQRLRYNFGTWGNDSYTYQYDTRSQIDRSDYSLRTAVSTDPSYTDGWQPIAQLSRTDAQVSLYFLSANEIKYSAPVDDPWFSAHNETLYLDIPLWTPDSPIRVLGCIDQEQFCSATDSQQCTPLRWVQSTDLDALDFNSAQLETARRIFLTTRHTGIWESVEGRGAMALRAQENTFLGFGRPPPNHQWQIEVSHWMGIIMAKLQHGVVQWASGPTNLPPLVVVELPTDISTDQCYNQKVRHTGEHISFSIVGMVIVFVVGGFFILLSLVIDTIGGFFQWLFGRGTHRQLQWIVNEKLQLLRLASEGAGKGTWSGAKDMVPLTEPGQVFSTLGGEDGGERNQNIGLMRGGQHWVYEEYPSDRQGKYLVQ